MKPCLLIVDMLKATFEDHRDHPIVGYAEAFIPALNNWLDRFHAEGLPVVFACDSFLQDDFIFTGKLPLHSIRGTKGAEVIDSLKRSEHDQILPKRRFSTFFKTDLDQTLRTLECDMVIIAGIATHICVLASALDAVSNDFKAVILHDCCAAHRLEYHEAVVNTYKKTPLYPLLQVLNSKEYQELFMKYHVFNSLPQKNRNSI